MGRREKRGMSSSLPASVYDLWQSDEIVLSGVERVALDAKTGGTELLILHFGELVLYVWGDPETYAIVTADAPPAQFADRPREDASKNAPWAWAIGRGVIWIWEVRRVESGVVEGLQFEFYHLEKPIKSAYGIRGQVQLFAMGRVLWTSAVLPCEELEATGDGDSSLTIRVRADE